MRVLPKAILIPAFCGLLTSGLFAQTTFTTSGTYTVPAGVTSIKVECWGGGGAGGGCTSGGPNKNNSGGGGAGGAFKTETVAVTPGQMINYTVGAGGVPVNAASGGNGGSSTFLTVTAAGGQGGGVGTGNGGNGAGGVTTIGDFNGGAGAAGLSSNYGGGGGAGAGNGGSGSAASGATGGTGGAGSIMGGNGANGPVAIGNGVAATTLGGGGSGGFNGAGPNSLDRIGGAGFRGQITIYTCVLELTSTTATSPICVGGNSTITLNGTASKLPAGTYTVTYDLSAPNSGSGLTATMTVVTAGTGTFTTGALANAGMTTITITNLNNGSCSSPQTINNTATIDVLVDPTAPSLNVATPAGGLICAGQNVSATFNAGTGGTGCTDEYQYSTNSGSSYSPYIPGTSIPTTGLAGQTVIIQTRRLCSGNGCDGPGETFSTKVSWTVASNPTATASAPSPYNGAQISCFPGQGKSNDGSATVTPLGGTPGYSYDWVGTPTGDGTPTITGLVAGTYTVTVTDANLCVTTAMVTLTGPTEILAFTCNYKQDGCQLKEGEIHVVASGGTGALNATWTAVCSTPPGPQGPGGPSPVPVTFTGLAGNCTYNIKVTDANGCIDQ